MNQKFREIGTLVNVWVKTVQFMRKLLFEVWSLGAIYPEDQTVEEYTEPWI